jgi:hypothetical protein
LLATIPTTSEGLRTKAEYFASMLPTGEDGKDPVILTLTDVAHA